MASDRTDRALQEFLDSLSQLPGSIIYRDQYLWRGLAPGDSGQVLTLDENLGLTWNDPPAGATAGVARFNPVHWYDVSQETYTDGAAIASLTDHGGAKTDLVPKSGAPAFSASKGAIEFNGTNDALAPNFPGGAILAQPTTIVLVTEIHRMETSEMFFDGDNYQQTTERQVFNAHFDGTKRATLWAGAFTDGPTGPTFPKAVWFLHFDGADSFIEINGTRTLCGSPGSNKLKGFTVGGRYTLTAGRFAQFDLYELAALGFRPTDTDLDDLRTELYSKWNITP